MKRLACVLLLAACGGTSTAGGSTAHGTNDDARQQLERANGLYQAMSLHIDCSDQTSLEDFVACFAEKLRGVVVSAEATQNEYAAVLRYNDPQWSVAALTGQGRIYRAIVVALAALEVPEIYPAALLEEDVQMSDEARRVAHEQVVTGVQTLIAHRSAPLVCAAAIFDVRALRLAKAHGIGGEHIQESVAQLSLLTDLQIGHCVDLGRSADDTLMAYSPGEFELQR